MASDLCFDLVETTKGYFLSTQPNAEYGSLNMGTVADRKSKLCNVSTADSQPPLARRLVP